MGEEKKEVVRLDGSIGMGIEAYLTIITADKVMGKKETTYKLPYTLIKTDVLQKYVDLLYILGYSVEKIIDSKTPIVVVSNEGVELDRGEESQ
ncbi:MAG: hypothetical protein C5B59_08560 [Bacteroidetes bacterium]|nr:MAG: hypothetical protein C5B59_08560 [Bacteroidota bacterium]